MYGLRIENYVTKKLFGKRKTMKHVVINYPSSKDNGKNCQLKIFK